MTIEDFVSRQATLLDLIEEKLKIGAYRFKPARRALIPKAGTSKLRLEMQHDRMPVLKRDLLLMLQRGPDFLRLANALSALYPKTSEEERLIDAMLLAVPR